MDIFNGEGVSDGVIVSMHTALLKGCINVMRRWDTMERAKRMS